MLRRIIQNIGQNAHVHRDATSGFLSGQFSNRPSAVTRLSRSSAQPIASRTMSSSLSDAGGSRYTPTLVP
ncbi:hypothetical protein E2C01_084836 [Portunus trituberculatus]|uniref:Uncharacterized protein n=1 Tax=Portunus trituberculatus TaxID=210409 RepID=A0A5B7JBZ2_PORTR|nr:hypothetical protein [Portunus trituberculatus]